MDNKKIIIICIILLIIISGIIIVLLTTVNYERIYITPNGTSIEVPANQTKYGGDFQGAKIWNWEKGILVTYNSNANRNIFKVVPEVGFNTINDLLTKNGEKQTIDGFTCYMINADELLEIHVFDFIKVNYKGKFYCIPLSNETTHDNILICCNDKNIAVHMAKSVQYKNVYPNNTDLNTTLSRAGNISGDLLSNARNYTSNMSLSDIESIVQGETGINLNDARNGIVSQMSKRIPT
ncbi:hypothetical protein [Methanobrevibacter sp.]|uniref:hypothetical protein n=1 Tax=Methanobrevibacter sp. TaxID=66852 RepID=UPI00388EE181